MAITESESNSASQSAAPRGIRKLDDNVINKIAAGEVVERPASVLKELVENSIDAGARNIEIEAHAGGTQSLLVRDDGTGIDHSQIELAFSRHATSKLDEFDDIEGIQTLGFRGEALPSIVSVSRVSLSTRTLKDEHGWQVQCEGGGALVGPQPVQQSVGTTVEVQDLFFNVPVRRKFLRAANTEYSYLDKLVKQMVLGRSDVSFVFTHNDKRSIRYRAAFNDTDMTERLASVFGDEFSQNCIRVELTRDDVKVSGWVSPPDQTRSQPDQQFLFVNARSIQDRSVMHAVRQAYMDVLYDSSRFPICALYLDIEPGLVDVNVHPAKAQVRFRRQRDVYSAVKRAVNGALEGERPGARITTDTPLDPSHRHERDLSSLQGKFSLPLESNWPSLLNETHRPQQSDDVQEPAEADTEVPPLGFALAQLGGAYILAENREGLIIVDMHASHERITYEKLKKEFDNTQVSSQELIVPIIIKVTSEEADAAVANSETLASLGLDVSLSADNVICVRSVPHILGKADIEQLVRDVIADLITHESSNRVEHVRNEILASMSCHSAIRANQLLSVPEMNGLLRQMEATENSGYCSHGRPTWKQISMKQLDKMFFRGR